MKYAIRNENGDHIRETRTIGEGRRGNQSPIIAQRATARIETGFGVNRNLEQQKQLRREGAEDRAEYRNTLTAEQQLERISERPGSSMRERVRLLIQMKTVESLEAAKLIITSLREGTQASSRKLGLKLYNQYSMVLND